MPWLGLGRRRNRGDQPLDPIRILTADVELNGYVAPTGQRITDILLRGQDLAFLPAGAKVAPENWVLVSAPDVLVVIPPPLATRPDWMDISSPMSVVVDVGPYRVTGTAHARRGDAADAAFRRRHPFLPLTGASITRDDDVEGVDVAIVNLGASTHFGPPG